MTATMKFCRMCSSLLHARELMDEMGLRDLYYKCINPVCGYTEKAETGPPLRTGLMQLASNPPPHRCEGLARECGRTFFVGRGWV